MSHVFNNNETQSSVDVTEMIDLNVSRLVANNKAMIGYVIGVAALLIIVISVPDISASIAAVFESEMTFGFR